MALFFVQQLSYAISVQFRQPILFTTDATFLSALNETYLVFFLHFLQKITIVNYFFHFLNENLLDLQQYLFLPFCPKLHSLSVILNFCSAVLLTD